MARSLLPVRSSVCLAALVGFTGFATQAIAQTPTPQNPLTGVTIAITGTGCLNIRKAPSTTGEIVTCLENGTVLKPIVQEKDEWLQLSSGNWVWKQGTSLRNTSPAPATPNPTAQDPLDVDSTVRILKYIPNAPMRGDDVERLQQKLNESRALATPLVVDGVFGEGTERAVKAFQRRNNLTVDGIAGPEVYRAIKFY